MHVLKSKGYTPRDRNNKNITVLIKIFQHD